MEDKEIVDISDNLAPLHAEMFRQLLEIPTFCEYLDTHYDIAVTQDDDNKYIGVTVNVVSMEESANRMINLKRDRAPKIIAPENKIIV